MFTLFPLVVKTQLAHSWRKGCFWWKKTFWNLFWIFIKIKLYYYYYIIERHQLERAEPSCFVYRDSFDIQITYSGAVHAWRHIEMQLTGNMKDRNASRIFLWQVSLTLFFHRTLAGGARIWSSFCMCMEQLKASAGEQCGLMKSNIAMQCYGTLI